MKTQIGKILIALSALSLLSCAHTKHHDSQTKTDVVARKPAYEGQLPALKGGVQPWSHNDPQLKKGEGGLTVWKLQEMATNREFEKLNDLFNNGVTMDSLPKGYSAGAGARVLGLPKKLDKATKALVWLTGVNWKGKIFFPSQDPRVSKGLNRIHNTLGVDLKLGIAQVEPLGAFVTKMINKQDLHQNLAPDAQSNLVLLNYAEPVGPADHFIEHILEVVQVYDVMVAVPGKYGPVYVGKTWLGSYDEDTGEFTTPWPQYLIAWYFLDFNEGALKEQEARAKAEKKTFREKLLKFN